MRACANPSAVRKVVTVFNTRDDATFTGTDDMVVLARLTARVKALVPAAHLVDNSIVPMRTRGKSPQNLGFLNVTLQGKDGMELQAVLNSLLQFSEKFTRLASIDSFPAGAAISIVVSEEARVGPLAKYLVIQGEATALAYSNRVPRHIGFGHCVLVANISLKQLLLKGGAQVHNEADVGCALPWRPGGAGLVLGHS